LFGIPIDAGGKVLDIYSLGLSWSSIPSVQASGKPPEGLSGNPTSYGGRRSGKSFVSAIVAVFLATFREQRSK
jgi:hypothetical protein